LGIDTAENIKQVILYLNTK